MEGLCGYGEGIGIFADYRNGLYVRRAVLLIVGCCI